MLKGFKSYTRKLDWILSCCIEILSRMPDEGDGDESSNGFQQQKFLEYTLFARIILLRGNSFMWKNCSWISWLKYHIMSIIIETLGFFLPPPQIMDHLEILNLEFLGFFFIFSYLLWGGTTQHTEVRRQLVGVNSPTIWVRDVKLRSSGLADTQLYRLSHLTSSPLKEFWFYFFGGCRCFKFYLLTFTCVSNLLAYMFVHHVNAYLEPTEAQRRHWDPGTGHRWCRLLYVPRIPGKAVNAF